MARHKCSGRLEEVLPVANVFQSVAVYMSAKVEAYESSREVEASKDIMTPHSENHGTDDTSSKKGKIHTRVSRLIVPVDGLPCQGDTIAGQERPSVRPTKAGTTDDYDHKHRPR